MMFLAILSFASFAPLALSAPIPNPLFGLSNNDPSTASVTVLSAAAVSAFQPQALLAQAAYCTDASAALPALQMILTGGDGGLIPRYFVAHDPASQSIVVAHEGTEKDNILSIVNDAEFLKSPLNQTFFPGASSDIETHSGFGLTFARTANDILGAVTKGLAANPDVSKVTVSGHSLGAALAVMTSVFLEQKVNGAATKRAAPVTLETVVFGLPRGGNQAWADFVDATLPNLVHMHNKNDIVPTVPPRALDYQHPQGELFVQPDTGNVVSCPGQENSNCSEGNSLADVSLADHKGPYAGELMGRSACPVPQA